MLEDRLDLLALGGKEDFMGYGGNDGYGGGVFNVSLDVALGENHSGNAPQGSFPNENSVAGDLSWNSLNRVEKAAGWCYCRSLVGSDRCSPPLRHFFLYWRNANWEFGYWS
ncbi:Uncharacterized protein Fot_33917 [Forsythia ovata]|uniref:Uncharacterized protein n=1 Tax=Forsythia ovata TaxID=205694 RepID=A0ABD1TC13_9LAMI